MNRPPTPVPDPTPSTLPREPLSLREVLRHDVESGEGEDAAPLVELVQALALEVARLSRALYGSGPRETARSFSLEEVEAGVQGTPYRTVVDELDIPADEELPCVGWFASIHRHSSPGAGEAGIRGALAAVFGAQTRILLSVGRGTHLLRMQGESGAFVLEEPGLTMPAPPGQGRGAIPAIPLAPGLLRILRKGGGLGPIPAHPRRRAEPAAFLAEQAGGAATDGIRRILDIAATSTEVVLPLFLGSPHRVPGAGATGSRGGTDPSDGAERAPLFGHRGLFRP